MKYSLFTSLKIYPSWKSVIFLSFSSFNKFVILLQYILLLKQRTRVQSVSLLTIFPLVIISLFLGGYGKFPKYSNFSGSRPFVKSIKTFSSKENNYYCLFVVTGDIINFFDTS